MTQTDYLLRLIEQMGAMLIALRKRILGGGLDADEAEEQLQSLAGKSGLDLDFLRTVSLDTLVMLMSPTGVPEPGRCWITAELFLVDATRAESAGDDEEAWDRYERSLRLFGLLDPGIVAIGLPEVKDRIREVQTRMSELADRRGGE